MANKKITDLVEVTSPADSDLLPIVSSSATKKIQVSNLRGTRPTPTAPTFTNSWVDFGGTNRVAGFYKDRGRVYVDGLIKNGTLNASAFTLPAGYRPADSIYRTVVMNGAFGFARVDADGTVNIFGASNTYVSVGFDFWV